MNCRQRGAIGLFAVLCLALMLLCLALVVDSGRLYLAKRSLQRVADMAALEAANLGGGCSSTSGSTDVRTLAVRAARSNGFDPEGSGRTLAARLGAVAVDGGGHRYLITDSSAAADAVEVVVTQQVPASLVLNLAAMFPGSGQSATVDLRAEAVAQSSTVASFSVGSGLLRLDSAQSPLLAPVLDGVLDGNVALDGVAFTGIASANVALLDFLQALQARAGVGTLDQLLGSRIGVLPYVEVVASLLRNEGVLASGLDGARLANIGSVGVTLGEVLGIDAATPREALQSNVNLFELLLVGAIAANGQRAVDLQLQIPGIDLAGAALQIIEAPRFAVGLPGIDPASGQWRTWARTGQLELVLKLKPQLPGLLTLNGTLVDAQVDLALRIGLAQAQGALERIECGNPQRVVIDAATRTDSVRLTSTGSSSKPASIQLTALGLPIIKADIGMSETVLGSAARDLVFEVSRSRDEAGEVLVQPSRSQTLSSGVAPVLPPLTGMNIQVLFGTCGLLDVVCHTVEALLSLVGGVTALLGPALNELGTKILQPVLDRLLDWLGIDLGFADITLADVRVSTPRLVR
ncbi:hypothetical protein FQZ97_398060 [compost metagenome]